MRNVIDPKPFRHLLIIAQVIPSDKPVAPFAQQLHGIGGYLEKSWQGAHLHRQGLALIILHEHWADMQQSLHLQRSR